MTAEISHSQRKKKEGDLLLTTLLLYPLLHCPLYLALHISGPSLGSFKTVDELCSIPRHKSGKLSILYVFYIHLPTLPNLDSLFNHFCFLHSCYIKFLSLLLDNMSHALTRLPKKGIKLPYTQQCSSKTESPTNRSCSPSADKFVLAFQKTIFEVRRGE